jgi:hypothetical protein
MVVCVDVFSKLIVAEAIGNKLSSTIAQFFHKNVICVYGCPQAVRCDNGREFLGHF